jgi:hypothetical protein
MVTFMPLPLYARGGGGGGGDLRSGRISSFSFRRRRRTGKRGEDRYALLYSPSLVFIMGCKIVWRERKKERKKERKSNRIDKREQRDGKKGRKEEKVGSKK